MWVYALIGVGIILLMLACYGCVQYLCDREKLEQLKRDNDRLIERNRKLKAENRRLNSQLSIKAHQVDSLWERKYAEVQEDNRELRQQLKVKDALLKAMEGKVAV